MSTASYDELYSPPNSSLCERGTTVRRLILLSRESLGKQNIPFL
jgi:hypothetical protein